MNPARLAQLQKQAGSVRTGGKGSMRRKKKVVRKNQVQNDKRLQQTIKRLPGAQHVRDADEVQFFKDDGTVLVLRQAQILAAFQSNWYASLSLATPPYCLWRLATTVRTGRAPRAPRPARALVVLA